MIVNSKKRGKVGGSVKGRARSFSALAKGGAKKAFSVKFKGKARGISETPEKGPEKGVAEVSQAPNLSEKDAKPEKGRGGLRIRGMGWFCT